jgi:hypothetical protein
MTKDYKECNQYQVRKQILWVKRIDEQYEHKVCKLGELGVVELIDECVQLKEPIEVEDHLFSPCQHKTHVFE